ncbi:MAG: PAC2 family protein [Nitrososphaerota archaeon]|nr:PAC2 family protein [Aigarchaeota archaeon]MDW8077039.1 PAC2 family protein [Nitrososphaerota archaeon]
METKVVLEKGVDLKGAYVIEIAPSPGAAGLIAGAFLIDALKAEKVGEILSPHFPQVSLVNEEGIASPSRIDLHFYFDKRTDLKLLFVIRNFPVESGDGSYLVAKKLYEFLKTKGVEALYCLGSGRITGNGEVFISTAKLEHAKDLLNAGAKMAPSQDVLPIDRLTSFLLLFFARDGKRTCLLLSDSPSYIPDPSAAKKLLETLLRAFKMELDLSKLDEDIKRYQQLLEGLEKSVLGQTEPAREERPTREPFYIG